MKMNKLWAPWRMDYIRTPKENGCVFCTKHQSKKDKENLLLFRGEESFVLMNLYPYTNGHLMISPYKHTSDPNDISAMGNQEIMFLANKSMEIIKKIMGADGFNFGANLGKAAGAGIEEHIHFHIVLIYLLYQYNKHLHYLVQVAHKKIFLVKTLFIIIDFFI